MRLRISIELPAARADVDELGRYRLLSDLFGIVHQSGVEGGRLFMDLLIPRAVDQYRFQEAVSQLRVAPIQPASVRIEEV